MRSWQMRYRWSVKVGGYLSHSEKSMLKYVSGRQPAASGASILRTVEVAQAVVVADCFAFYNR